MDLTADITKVKELLDKANDILVVTHEHPTFDSIGSTLALYLGLIGLGKKVSIVCPDAMTVELSSFIGVNKFVRQLTDKNFIISLDYEDGSIEKVSYNIEGNKFNLVIEPRTGQAGFSQDKVHYSTGGSAADLIIAVDTIHLGGLKKVYEENKELFTGKTVVNIDRHPNNALYGQMNVIDPQASSTAEVVSQFLSGVGVRLTPDIATNVLNALYGATNAFQSAHVNAQVFELAAACVKAGGKRFWKPSAVEEVPTEPVVETPKPAAKPTEAPPDWLKPKIYKSSNLL
jgi:nanoRNase/pAp phosphatase (c-di-AMP/oligoRNAs hydrolase)